MVILILGLPVYQLMSYTSNVVQAQEGCLSTPGSRVKLQSGELYRDKLQLWNIDQGMSSIIRQDA